MIRRGVAVTVPLLLAAIAMSPGHADDADATADIALGRALFTSVTPSCATCHTLHAVDASGTIGPSLDELRPEAARVEAALRDGLNAMPSYAETLSDAQIRALALFVADATHQVP
jgi:sulfite dehydrogenase